MWLPGGWADYLYWQETNRKTLHRINELIRDALRSPFVGIGKPEPLKGNLKGWWSRRITGEHRLVYRVEAQILVIMRAGSTTTARPRPHPPRRAHERAAGRPPGGTRVSRVGEGVPPSRTFPARRFGVRSRFQYRRWRKVRPGGTPGPTRETRVLPGVHCTARLALSSCACSGHPFRRHRSRSHHARPFFSHRATRGWRNFSPRR